MLTITQDDTGRLKVNFTENDLIWALGAVEAAQRLMVLDLFKSARAPEQAPTQSDRPTQGEKGRA